MAYIRTIHTSFTAAHPNPWARPAVAPLVNMHQPLYPSPQKYATQPTQAPPASGAGGRRRAYAFRAPAAPQHPVCKFDPFGDEPTAPVPNLATLASLSAPPTPRLAAASLPPPVHRQYAVQPHHLYQQKPSNYLPPRRQNRGGYNAGPHHAGSGFNNQRPRHAPSSFVEAPTEIWRSNSPSSRTRYEFEEYNGEGGSGVSSQPRVQARRTSPPPAPIPAQVRRTPSPPAPTPAPAPTQQQQNRFLYDKDAKAKLVAGILLNRVHAVGRPRRRVPSPVGGKKPYVPSGLSQVVACAA